MVRKERDLNNKKIRQTIRYDVGSCNEETQNKIGVIKPLTGSQAKETKQMFSESKAQILERSFRIGQVVVGWMNGKLNVVIGDNYYGEYDDIVRMNEEVIVGIKITNRGIVKEFLKHNGFKQIPKKEEVYIDWRIEAMRSLEGFINMIYVNKQFGITYQRGGFYIRCEENVELKKCTNVHIGIDECCGYKTAADREYVGIYNIERSEWILEPTFSKLRIDKKIGLLWGTNEIRYGINSFMSKNQLYYLNSNLAKIIIENGFHHVEKVNSKRVLAMVLNEKGKYKYIDLVKSKVDGLAIWIKQGEYTDVVITADNSMELIESNGKVKKIKAGR